MPSITINAIARGYVPKLLTDVYVNGSLRRDVEMVQVTRPLGLSGCTFSGYVGEALYDSSTTFLEGAEIVCYARHEGESSGPPLFRGFVQTIQGQLSNGEDALAFTAVSPLALLHRVQIGQKALKGTILFRRLNRETGVENNWTPASMIAVAFDSSTWPDGWAEKLRLGNTAVLTTGTAATALKTDMPFVVSSYHEFLETVLGLVGDVTVRERFTDDTTLLDFVRIEPASTGGYLRVAALGDSAVSGCNVSEITDARDLRGMATRVIGYGSPRLIVVTATTDHATDPLLPNWRDATQYGAPGPYTADEQAVIDDPDSAIPGNLTYVPGREKIFREFALPSALRHFAPVDSLPFLDSLGRAIRAQGFIYRNEMVEDTVDGAAAFVADGEEATPTLQAIEGFDPKQMTVTFARPVLRLLQQYVGADGPVVEYERCDLSLTFALSLSGREFGYDTGIRGDTALDGIGDDGLAHFFHRNDLQYWQATSLDIGLVATGGGELEMPCSYYDEATDTWNTYTEQTVIRDDSSSIAQIAEAKIRARNRLRRTANIGLEYVTQGVLPGSTIRVDNGGSLGPAMLVQTVVWSGANGGSTEIVASDARADELVLPAARERFGAPRPNSSVKASEAAATQQATRAGTSFAAGNGGVSTGGESFGPSPRMDGGTMLTPLSKPTFGPEPPPRDMSLGQRKPRNFGMGMFPGGQEGRPQGPMQGPLTQAQQSHADNIAGGTPDQLHRKEYLRKKRGD